MSTVPTATKSQLAEINRLLSIPTSARHAPQVLQLDHNVCVSGDPTDRRRVTTVYRMKSLLVHPDRCPDPSATEAIAILNKAYEDVLAGTICNPAPPPPKPKSRSTETVFSSSTYADEIDHRIARAARKARLAQEFLDRTAREAQNRSYEREQRTLRHRDKLKARSANDLLHDQLNLYDSLDDVIDDFIVQAGKRADGSDVAPMMTSASRSRSNEEMGFWNGLEAAQKRDARAQSTRIAEQRAAREEYASTRDRERQIWEERIRWRKEASPGSTGYRWGGFGSSTKNHERDKTRKESPDKKEPQEREKQKDNSSHKILDPDTLVEKLSALVV